MWGLILDSYCLTRILDGYLFLSILKEKKRVKLFSIQIVKITSNTFGGSMHFRDFYELHLVAGVLFVITFNSLTTYIIISKITFLSPFFTTSV